MGGCEREVKRKSGTQAVLHSLCVCVCVTDHAMLLHVMLCHVVHVGGVQQRLGRDAANIEAGSTQCTTLLDARSLCVGKGKGREREQVQSLPCVRATAC